MTEYIRSYITSYMNNVTVFNTIEKISAPYCLLDFYAPKGTLGGI